MNFTHFTPGVGDPTVVITRVAETHWHAVGDDRVAGRGEAFRRPDGRIFLSVDAWHGPVFDRLAEAMLAALPRPLYTVVDEADLDLTAHWERAGFRARGREWELLVSTDPRETGLGSAQPPPGVTTLAVGEAHEGRLRELDRVVRQEIGATVGWAEMPAEVLGAALRWPSRYAAAAESDRYVGLLRVVPLPRQPRIGLIAVRADRHRRGIARAMLARVLGGLHGDGIETVSADVRETNAPAMALFEGLGARRASSNLELVVR